MWWFHIRTLSTTTWSTKSTSFISQSLSIEYEQLTNSNDAILSDFKHRLLFFSHTKTTSICALLHDHLDQPATTFRVLNLDLKEDVQMFIVNMLGKFNPPATTLHFWRRWDLCENPLKYVVRLIQKAHGWSNGKWGKALWPI